MKNLFEISRREFVTLAATGLSLSMPRSLAALAEKAAGG
jgi:hypothetical protein